LAFRIARTAGKPSRDQSDEADRQAILHGEISKHDDRIMILAPIVSRPKRRLPKELEKFAQDGYVRARNQW